MKIITCLIALTSILLFGSAVSAMDVFPVKYEKVSFSWKSDTMFEGIIKVYLQNNTGEEIHDVIATISSAPANTKVIDGTVTFERVPAGETVLSQDGFTVHTDTGNPVDPNEGVTWEISYKDSDGNTHVLQSVPEFPAGE